MTDTCPNCRDGTVYLGKADFKHGGIIYATDDVYQCMRCYWGIVIPREVSSEVRSDSC